MRFILGVILGAILTVTIAFIHDNWVTGTVTTGAPAAVSKHHNMVNWDVVSANWRTARRRAHEAWTTLSHKVSG
jgi:hypothetical protein